MTDDATLQTIVRSRRAWIESFCINVSIVLLSFATIYLCEIVFLAPGVMKNKYRVRVDVTKKLRVALSKIIASFNKLCVNLWKATPAVHSMRIYIFFKYVER